MTTSNLFLTMDSLNLPSDLLWDGKMEPSSPSCSEDLLSNQSISDNWILDDNFANGLDIIQDHDMLELSRANSTEQICTQEIIVQFLDSNDPECLLDQKILSYIDYGTSTLSSLSPVIDETSSSILPITKAQAVAAEFQQAPYEAAAVLAQLTPPQSPPQCSAGYQQQQATVKSENKVLTNAIDAVGSYNFNSWQSSQEATDGISNENEREIDEIVKIRVQELDWQQYNDDCESQTSSEVSSGNVSGNGSNTEEEWQPGSNGSSPCYPGSQISSSSMDELQLSAPASPLATCSNSSRQEGSEPVASSSGLKKRTRTYGRGVEDRKIRKKEQNKNAATRYRQKKKAEMENVLNEEQILADENAELRRTLTERRRELRYLRQLIREFYQGRKR